MGKTDEELELILDELLTKALANQLREKLDNVNTDFENTVVTQRSVNRGTQSQAQKNLKEQFENLQAHFQEKLTSLEKKQDKHNNLIERVYHTEKQISVIMEKIKVENHRIDDLEKERG